MKFVRWDWKEEPINSNFGVDPDKGLDSGYFFMIQSHQIEQDGLPALKDLRDNYICRAAVPMSASLLIGRYAFI